GGRLSSMVYQNDKAGEEYLQMRPATEGWRLVRISNLQMRPMTEVMRLFPICDKYRNMIYWKGYGCRRRANW
ncbi:hypothetical protein CFC21_061613, partial [Triticum aestivum]